MPSTIMGRSFEDANDPLTALMAPPEDETPEERSAREAREAEARRVSNEIDEQIRSERAAAKKKKKPVKVLLLGQSESGKSATLKNFQLTYAPKEWMHERMAWKAVIQLNLVRNVNAILDLIVRSKSTSSAGHNNSLGNGNGANGNGYYHADGYLTPGGVGGAEYLDSGVIDPHYASTSTSASSSSSAAAGALDAYSYAHLKVSSSSSLSAAGAGGVGEAGPSSSSSPSAPATAPPSSFYQPQTPSALPAQPVTFTEHHHLLRMRLSPLRQVQKDLEWKLGDAAFEPTARDGSGGGGGGGDGGGGGVAGGAAGTSAKHWEFGIRSTNGWKSALDKFRPGSAGNGGESGHGAVGGLMTPTSVNALGKRRVGAREMFSHGSHGAGTGSGGNGGGGAGAGGLSASAITECIAACREDIVAIWQDAVVRKAAGVARLRMEEMPGFFLNDVDRIARTEYEPTDEDVVRARLRTMGVQSHRFVLESGKAAGQEWLMYDFAGSRSSRAIWASFFDDVDAVLFLAPISCFDEMLAEDRSVNRLEDSFLLWRLLCSSKLLARTQLILFLNKCDLLTKKLERGVKVRESVPSFGDKKNESEVVQKYFHQHFKEISRQHSPEPRTFFAFFTSIIDTKATAVTLGLVEEGILRAHLKRADLL